MKLIKLKEEKRFALAQLDFATLKVIRDACQEYGQKGSTRAAAIADELKKQLELIAI